MSDNNKTIDQIFGLDGKEQSDYVNVPKNLPIVDGNASNVEVKEVKDKAPEPAIKQAASKVTASSVVSAVLPYVALFLMGVALYYIFFTDFSFQDLKDRLVKYTSSEETVATKKAKALAELKKQRAAAYGVWVRSYFFEVNDGKFVDMDADLSGNGLSNFQKYLLGLNPRVYSSLQVEESDTEKLLKGINPLTNKPLTEKQQALIDSYIDLDLAKNRSILEAQNPSKITPAGSLPPVELNNPQEVDTHNHGGQGTSSAPVQPASMRSLSPVTTPVITSNTAPKAPVKVASAATTSPKTNTQSKSSSDVGKENIVKSFGVGTGYNECDIDLNKNATLEIPSLKITVPVIFSKSMKEVDADLNSGVIHLPGTALPCDLGTSYISGHSSGYSWSKGSYNKIFDTLDKLPKYSNIYLTITTSKGKQVKLTYIVDETSKFKPNDQKQFENLPYSRVALSTCWPIGSVANRLVVYARLSDVK